MMTEPSTLLIRCDARPEDSPRIRQMVADTDYFSEAETEIAVELIDERLAKGDASDYHFVFAEAAGQMVGYACFGPIPCTVGSYDLYWIVVDVTHQRGGVGQLLMRQVESRVRELAGRAIYIDTSGRDQYASTQRFYERCGYQVVANLPDFYAPDDPKLVYCKRLSEAAV